MPNYKLKTDYIMPKRGITYGDNFLPYHGAIKNKDLHFPNAKLNQQDLNYVELKYIINPRLPYKKNSYGNTWYPNMYIDLMYNPCLGGYVNSNGPIGPYFAQGLGNYPRSMYREVNYGKKNTKKSSKNTKPSNKKSKK